MKNKLVTIFISFIAAVALAALGPGMGWTVHVPATTVTLVSPATTGGSIYAVRQISVLNLASVAYALYSSNPSMTSNGVALINNAIITIDQDDNNAYYFWSTNAFDVAGNGWARR